MKALLIRFGLSIGSVLTFASSGFGQSQGGLNVEVPAYQQASAMRVQQEVFQVGVRNNQRLLLLEQLRAASPLTYYDSDWRNGTVKLADGREVKATMRYNLLARMLEVRKAGLTDSVLALNQIQTIQLGTAQPAVYREFAVHPYGSEISRRDYNLFEKISQTAGPLQLLLLHEVILEKSAPLLAPGGTGRPAEEQIQRVSRLYVRTPKRPSVQEISLSKPGVLRLFDKDANRMSQYAAEHGLSFNNLAHVVQLVDEYNKTVKP
jgi:hypothetical protein